MIWRSVKFVTLPDDPEEIMRRLRSVYDDDYTAERFYYRIASLAGRRLKPEGVTSMFIQELLRAAKKEFTAAYLLFDFIPDWLDALIDDAKAKKIAKQTYKRYKSRVEKT